MTTLSTDTAYDPTRRNVLLLAACQALGMTGTSMMMIFVGLVGYSLAIDKSLATLPLALAFVGTMLTTIPASALMRRIGRRMGFSIGALIGIASALLAAYAIAIQDFWLYVAASIGIGIQTCFIHFYRFAAADTASESFRPRAISLVLAGGVVAALVGAPLARATRGAIPENLYVGCYLAVAVLAVLSLVVLQFIRIPPLTAEQKADHGRPIAKIASQPTFIVAVLASAIGYGVMTLVMTTTPLAMDSYDHGFSETSWVIQWHALAMFVPSFFTGRLIKKFGATQIILVGGCIMIACVLVALSGTGFWHFWIALFSLGLGWNFMFVGGTSLATETYTIVERNKTQALNDFIVFTTVACSSLASGALHHWFGWEAVVIGVTPLLAVAIAAVLYLHINRRLAAMSKA
ncbi:MAG: MFS transporter [Pseudomonadota bacterium]